MVKISISAALLVAASLVAATPVQRENVVSIPLQKKAAATSPSSKTILAVDAARFAKFKGTATSSTGDATATNLVDQYVVAVKVGSQTFSNMIVDTGSSNTWVGADTKFSAGSTGKSTGKSVEVSYGSGDFSGTEYTDTVSESNT
jgi:hypothetical protein